jgi:hypothetical protein
MWFLRKRGVIMSVFWREGQNRIPTVRRDKRGPFVLEGNRILSCFWARA